MPLRAALFAVVALLYAHVTSQFTSHTPPAAAAPHLQRHATPRYGTPRRTLLTQCASKGRIPPQASGLVRVNRVLCEKHSRRQADRLVEQGRVRVNGAVASHGTLVGPGDAVKLDGKRVPFPADRITTTTTTTTTTTVRSSPPKATKKTRTTPVYIVYHKPTGVECTTDRSIPGNIVDAVGHRQRVFPVGRLDKDTTGVILLTSDGLLPEACLRAERGKRKTYEVTTDRPVDPVDVGRLARGVVITTAAQRDRTSAKRGRQVTARTKPCTVRCIGGGGRKLRVTLVEGRNRQVRRMFSALGYKVKQLHRSKFMGITCRGIPVGEWRPVDKVEMGIIEGALQGVRVATEGGAD